MKSVLYFSLFVLIFSSGCTQMSGHRVRGSGHITPETRNTSGFDAIDVSGAIDVYVKQDSTTSIKVEADDNLLQYVVTETNGSTLEIYTDGGFNLRPSHKIKVYVSNPTYTRFDVSGASSIEGESQVTATERISVSASGASGIKLDVNVPVVDVELTGASNANLRGRTKDLDISASGASKVKGYDLLSENANVDVSGASHADVYASVRLDGEATGASHVSYLGNAVDNVKKSGASHVSKKNN